MSNRIALALARAEWLRDADSIADWMSGECIGIADFQGPQSARPEAWSDVEAIGVLFSASSPDLVYVARNEVLGRYVRAHEAGIRLRALEIADEGIYEGESI